jgi:hypothetical protein
VLIQPEHALTRRQVAKDEAAGVPNRTLAPAQLAGLRHYKDLRERIPHNEVRRPRAWHAQRRESPVLKLLHASMCCR